MLTIFAIYSKARYKTIYIYIFFFLFYIKFYIILFKTRDMDKIWFFNLIAEYRRVVIIRDSIAKNITGISGAAVQSLRGYTIAQVAMKLDQDSISLVPYDYVTLHVGINDIDNRASYNNIISDFGNLIAICRKKAICSNYYFGYIA